jgi:TolB protein
MIMDLKNRTHLLRMIFSLLIILQMVTTTLKANAQTEKANGLYIKIGDAKLKKSLLAIPPFQFSGSPASSKTGLKPGKELFDTFRNDMELSGFFEFIKPAAFIGDMSKLGLKPAPGEPGGFKFESWKQIGTEFLIRVGYRVLDGKMTVDAYAYYVPQAKQVLSKTYKADAGDARTLAHTFSNDLIKELTGQPGVFLSKIVTVRSTKPEEKEIFLMDWDGADAHQITHHKSIATSPTFSWDGKMIAYSVFTYHPREKSRNLDLFTYDLESAKRFVIAYQKGINSGANFAPDNKHIFYTNSNGGAPDLFKVGIDGHGQTKITSGHRGEMNVEPSVSPDGKRIAFSSDRSGKPMIYMMNIDGSEIKRITYAGDFNSTPAWSPDGTKLVFAAQDKDHYDIFIMNPDGTNMARLTSAKKSNGRWANNEEPTFSPDGRQVLFRSNRTGRYQLYIVSNDGDNERRITFDNHDYFKPHWSPAFE